jgi:hypothetical protein
MNPKHSIPFLQIGKAVAVQSNPGKAPKLIVNWETLNIEHPVLCWISVTHTEKNATVIVILEQAHEKHL